MEKEKIIILGIIIIGIVFCINGLIDMYEKEKLLKALEEVSYFDMGLIGTSTNPHI